MTSKKTLLALLLTGLTLSAQAQRTDAEMVAIATQQLYGNAAKSIHPTIGSIHRLYQADELSIYGDDANFVVVSHNENATPVLGYAHTPFNTATAPAAFNWWLEATNLSLQDYDDVRVAIDRNLKVVEPLIPTVWGQGSPFNSQCPKISGTAVPSGCVATAMAQILYFYQYPAQGRGSGRYTLSDGSDNNSNKTVSITGKYNYSSMLTDYRTSSGSLMNQRAVATLMRDCGYAAAMNYAPDGSGTNMFDAAKGLVYNMVYDSLALRLYTRSAYTDNEWINMAYDQLEAGQPILYSGSDPTAGGHAFILDGIDANGLVHVNWGWDGVADGYFDITNLNPQGILGTTGRFTFNNNQQMIVGYRTDETPTEDEGYETIFCTSKRYTFEADGENIVLNLTDYYNMGFLTVDAFLAICFFDQEDGNLVSGINLGGDVLETGSGYRVNRPISISLNDSDQGILLPPGDYDIILASVQNSDLGYVSPLRIEGEGALIYSMTKKDDGTLVIHDEAVNVETGVKPVFFNDAPNLPAFEGVSGTVTSTTVYDLMGRVVTSPVSGQVYVVRYTFSDGSVRSIKRIER